jgi:alkylated DNA nucleotide flippase Atl1
MSTKTARDKFMAAEKNGGVIEDTKKGRMYISTPSEIQTIVEKVPNGKLITTAQIASQLTRKYKVDFTCPLTTGIFFSLVANLAEEERSEGKKDITPYWRVVKPKGYLYDKYLGQTSHQYDYLVAEGFEIKPTGKKVAAYEIKDYEKYLV